MCTARLQRGAVMKFTLNFPNYVAAPFLSLASNLKVQDGISGRSLWNLLLNEDIFSTYFNVYIFTIYLF